MIFLKFAINTRETKQLSAPSLLNLTGQSLIPFRHVMKNGLPLNQLFGLGWTFSFPKKTIKKRLDDPPWMTQHLKSLIQQRQKALAKGHDQSIGNENNAGVNTMTQMSVNLKSLNPNGGGNLLSTCVEWIQSTTSMISDIFNARHPLVMKLMKPTRATHLFHTWRIP
jgi:hypothetical protein